MKIVFGFIFTFLSFIIPKRTVKTILAFILLSVDMPVKYIAIFANLCNKTVYKYKKELSSGNINKFFVVNHRGRKCKLFNIEQDIINEIHTNNYHSLQQIADMIFEKFEIKISSSAVGKFLKKHKIRRLKSGSIPAKADPEKQRFFCESTLRPLMNEAKSGAISLLYLDASHFVMGCDYLGYIYGKCRRFLKTFSGRMRYNVLGALDISTKAITTITNDLYIKADNVIQLLDKIAKEYKGKVVYIILDNASYQRCRIVQDHAKSIGINLIFIPPYSPNLNLIERFWKYTKSNLRTKFYDNFSDFCDKINSIINNIDNKHSKEINSLISDHFQFFDKLERINETTFVNAKGKNLTA